LFIGGARVRQTLNMFQQAGFGKAGGMRLLHYQNYKDTLPLYWQAWN
jgi:hypothetical protein